MSSFYRSWTNHISKMIDVKYSVCSTVSCPVWLMSPFLFALCHRIYTKNTTTMCIVIYISNNLYYVNNPSYQRFYHARYWYSKFVCLSVRDVPVSDENGLTYCRNFFTIYCSPIILVLSASNIFTEFRRRGHPCGGAKYSWGIQDIAIVTMEG